MMANDDYVSIHRALLHMTAQLLSVSLLLMERGKPEEGIGGIRDAIKNLEGMRDGKMSLPSSPQLPNT